MYLDSINLNNLLKTNILYHIPNSFCFALFQLTFPVPAQEKKKKFFLMLHLQFPTDVIGSSEFIFPGFDDGLSHPDRSSSSK